MSVTKDIFKDSDPYLMYGCDLTFVIKLDSFQNLKLRISNRESGNLFTFQAERYDGGVVGWVHTFYKQDRKSCNMSKYLESRRESW